jgi:soluble lytic murein transglycosylase-like protein
MLDWLILCFAIFSLSTTDTKYQLNMDDIRTACYNTNLIIDSSNKHNVDKFILAAIVWNESRWNPEVVSSAGACGLTQVLRGTFKLKCRELFEPSLSIDTGARILRIFKDEYNTKYMKYKSSYDEDTYSIACYAVGINCLESKYALNHSRRILKLARKYEVEYEKFNYFIFDNHLLNGQLHRDLWILQ